MINKPKSYIYKILFYIWFTLNSLIALGGWQGVIKFGYGLADILFIFAIIIILIIAGIYFFRIMPEINNNNLHLNINIFMIFCLLFSILIFLLMTFFRGPACRWDGTVFF